MTPDDASRRAAVEEHFLAFADELAAELFVFERLSPYCEKIHRQVDFKNGLRPDIGFRLKALPAIPLLLEVNFRAGSGLISTFCDAIAQGSSYAELTGHAVFIGPLIARGPMQLDWIHSSIGIALLLVGEFNVGALLFAPANPRYPTDRIGSLLLGGQAIATFTVNVHGDPCTTLHSNAERLLKRKTRFGSLTRKLG
jgi:hypothetical protein